MIMNKDKLIEFLKERGKNEGSLSESGVTYVMHNMSDESCVSGYAIVKVEEGILLIPYGEVIPEYGYEQLIADRAKLIGEETNEVILQEMEGSIKAFKEMLCNKKVEKKLFQFSWGYHKDECFEMFIGATEEEIKEIVGEVHKYIETHEDPPCDQEVMEDIFDKRGIEYKEKEKPIIISF